MKKINWIKFRLHCQDMAQLAIEIQCMETWAKPTADKLEQRHWIKAAEYLLKAVAELNFIPSVEPNSTRIVVPLDEESKAHP